MNLTKEKVEEAMNESWRKFTWDYPTVTSNKFIPRFLSFVRNPKTMKEVFVNGFYKGWLQSVEQLAEDRKTVVEALEKAEHGLKIGVDTDIVRARIIEAIDEIKEAK